MARLSIYVIGLLFVVGAAWVFLTQTEWGQAVPGGVALAVILLLVGIGVMASAQQLRGGRETRRVVGDGPGGARDVDTPRRGEYYEERRYD